MNGSDNIIVTLNTVNKLLTEKQLELLKKVSSNNKVTFQTKSFSCESLIYIIKRNKLYLLDGDKETPVSSNGYIRMSTYINYNKNSYWVAFNVKFSRGKKSAIDLHKFETVDRPTSKAAKIRAKVVEDLKNKTQKIEYKTQPSGLLGLIKRILSMFK